MKNTGIPISIQHDEEDGVHWIIITEIKAIMEGCVQVGDIQTELLRVRKELWDLFTPELRDNILEATRKICG
jgi:hypothetical protein